MKKFIYSFGKNGAEGNYNMTDILGGKGANLAEMCHLKLPIPSGFTISTEVCKEYYKNNRILPNYAKDGIKEALTNLEKETGRKLGDIEKPLFISIRSGSRSSMPGMMDTILNLGMNDITIETFSDKRFAYDSYRRFIQMYCNVVLGIDMFHFEEIIEQVKNEHNIIEDSAFTEENLFLIVQKFKDLVQSSRLGYFTQNVHEQLENSIKAVFDSWMNNRAISYRKINNIPEGWGTAVNIQVMVFGNLNNNSASGVAFTRNPSNGKKELFGEYLVNAQGEDVVSGVRTPKIIQGNMQVDLPETYQKLVEIQKKLENHYRDVQDIEFTIQDGKLWLLQTRSAKRTAVAAINTAIDMMNEGLITKQEAIMKVKPNSLEQLIHPTLDETADCNIIAKGLPAAPGAASGIVAFSTEAAVQQAKSGKNVILVRNETSPEDINGMNSAVGILTTCGGMTSHAAVVSRGMGKVCVCGADSISIDYDSKQFTTKGKVIVKAGEIITLDGSSGRVILGEAITTEAVLFDKFNTFMHLANDFAQINIRANADNVKDIQIAKLFNANGIGLCRTEHMFFNKNNVDYVRRMILAETKSERLKALKEIEKIQMRDFKDIFKKIGNMPITIRLLDPPLHEFLPQNENAIQELAKKLNLTYSFVTKRVSQLKETNPMLGHRGCRLGISYPEIYETQIRAIFSAASSLKNFKLEIMIPFVMNEKDFIFIKQLVKKTAQNFTIDYLIGNMIELPSSALNADKIGLHSDFFSFGTNDLTQTTLGLSRDDSTATLNSYKEQEILGCDPFISLQQEDVGELVKIAIERGRKVNKNLKLGICGEHGGDPKTVHFCAEIGLDYISCSPYRIPIARLAAAQYAIKNNESN